MAESDFPDTPPALADFWSIPDPEREDLLLRGVLSAHAHHYEHNTAYRNTVAARGVGPCLTPAELPRVLRTTSQAFRSYIDILGTPFAQDRASDFAEWLAENTSVDLRSRPHRFRSRYRSLESLLSAVERAYAAFGLEVLTSSGTSGRVALVPRDRQSTGLAVESFSLSFQRYLDIQADCTAVFMTPKRTRIATARMARAGVSHVGLTADRLHFTVPLPASPDRVRIAAGRTYRRGLRGGMERRIWHPLLSFAERRLLDAQAVESAISHLIPAVAHGEKVLLFGSPAELHGIASFLLDSGRTMTLSPNSLLVTTGGVKKAYAKTPAEMLQDLQEAFRLPDGGAVPVRDIYGVAEAAWAAMQCAHGNYHLPPWVLAVTLDDEEAFQTAQRSTGLLAFYDPIGSDAFPAFFRTTDQVTLVKGLTCPCGEKGDYLEEASILRVDPLGGSGCADLT